MQYKLADKFSTSGQWTSSFDPRPILVALHEASLVLSQTVALQLGGSAHSQLDVARVVEIGNLNVVGKAIQSAICQWLIFAFAAN
jgi:hypothetical protein